LLILFTITPFLHAQSNSSELRSIQLVWHGGEHALHYIVEIHRLIDGAYQNYLSETTRTLYYNVSLAPDEYRFRIIPYDILGRPAEASQWVNFEVHSVPVSRSDVSASTAADFVVEKEQPQVISIEEHILQVNNGQIPEDNMQGIEYADALSAKFNTFGISVGSAFIDPVVIIILSLHGSISSPSFQNLFLEIGCDFGFISIYEDVDSYFSIYPYFHLGYFIPFDERAGLFLGVGYGYMRSKYSLEFEDGSVRKFRANYTAGIKLFRSIIVSYTLRRDKTSASNKVALGFVFNY